MKIKIARDGITNEQINKEMIPIWLKDQELRKQINKEMTAEGFIKYDNFGKITAIWEAEFTRRYKEKRKGI